MSVSRWRFVNRTNPSESIVVQDVDSARTLARILQAYCGTQWILQEEIALETMGSVGGVQGAQKSPQPVQQPVQSGFVTQEEPTANLDLPTEPAETVAPPLPTYRPGDNPHVHAGASVSPPNLFQTEKKSGKRRHSRYKLDFRIILVSGGRSFRTLSADISVGGMLLKQKVPASMLNQICTVFIGSRKASENIELRARIIGDPSNPCRVTFVDCDTQSLKRLEQWIMEAGAPKTYESTHVA